MVKTSININAIDITSTACLILENSNGNTPVNAWQAPSNAVVTASIHIITETNKAFQIIPKVNKTIFIK